MRELLEQLALLLGASKDADSAKEFVNTLIDDDGKPKAGSKKFLEKTITATKKVFFDDGKEEGIREGKTQGEGKAQREQKEQWEKDIAKALGVDVGKVTKMASDFKKKTLEDAAKKEITDNDVLNHPAHLKAVEKQTKKFGELEIKYNELSTSVSTKDTVASLHDVLWPAFEAKYRGTKKAFQRSLEQFVKSNSFKKDGDKFVPTDANGNLLRSTDSPDPISLVDHFEKTEVVDYYETKVASPDVVPDPSKPVDPNNPKPTPKTFTKDSFKTAQEWSNAIKTATPEDRSAIMDASREWEGSQTD